MLKRRPAGFQHDGNGAQVLNPTSATWQKAVSPNQSDEGYSHAARRVPTLAPFLKSVSNGLGVLFV